MADSNYMSDSSSNDNSYGGDNQNLSDSYGSNQEGGSLYNNDSSLTESAGFSSDSGFGPQSSPYGGSSGVDQSQGSQGDSSPYGGSLGGDQSQNSQYSSSPYGDYSGGANNAATDPFGAEVTEAKESGSSEVSDFFGGSEKKDDTAFGNNMFQTDAENKEKKSGEQDAKKQSNDLKSEVGKEEKIVKDSKSVEAGDALPLILGAVCVAFFLLIQNFAQACRRYCQTDSSLSNSIISGASLGYLLLKGFPFMFNLVYAASPQIKNLYLKQHGHLLLIALMAFGLGFLFNYFFEKKIARNTVEDVTHSKTLYRLNLSVLTAAFFFSGLTVLNIVHLHYIDVFQYALFIGLMLCIETATLCYVFTDRNDLIRRIVLSFAVILGFVVGKFSAGLLAPSIFSIGFGFVLGFFVFTTIRVELATVKRNSNYSAFIVSFMSIAALTLIQSLYESLKC